MSEFSTTTAFRLVRSLALQPFGSAMYLLISDAAIRTAVEDDLTAEVQVQLGLTAKVEGVLGESASEPMGNSLRIFRIDSNSPELVAFLDTHVVRLERLNSQLLFLATEEICEQLLTSAPNFRSRLSDILHLVPEATA